LSRHIIAGIDPGATVGIALLDLSGRRIALRSTDGGMQDAVRIIESFGTPSLIACDVTPPPETVQKIASYFSCRLFYPRQNVREEEKRAIARGSPVQNNHERDAYAASVLAYRQHANKLRQIDALADLKQKDKDRIKHLLLRGYHLKDAFASLEQPEKEEERTAEKKAAPKAHVLSIEELRLRVSSLARENANLRLLAEKLEAEKQQLSSRLQLLQNDYRRSMLQDSELRRLKYQLQQSLERLSSKKQQKKVPDLRAPPKKHGERSSGKDTLNKLAEPKLDLEKLVAEYRKGRK
jgi:hypothetical protein